MTHLVKLKTLALAATFVCLAAVTPFPTMAAYVPVQVAYTITGSAGNWVLDFSVTNNLTPAPSDMSLYLFGVQLSAPRIEGSPTGYEVFRDFNPSFLGGSDTVYNAVWSDPLLSSGDNSSLGQLFPGGTLSGFQAQVGDQSAPANVPYFAFGISSSGEYTGGGNFFTKSNPGFEGVAQGTVSPVPIPAAVVLFGSGLAGLAGVVGWKRKRLSKTA